MSPTIFLCILGALLAGLLRWSFTKLPQERYQILASIPKVKDGEHWHGINFTYYGFILSSAATVSSLLFLFLLGIVGIHLWVSLGILTSAMLFAIPAAKWMAYIIEHKRHNFTVGGASFVGTLCAPLIVYVALYLSNSAILFSLAILPILTAMSIAFIIGEGLGRLGCISFGCCYGKPLSRVSPWLQKLFCKWHFIFDGNIKKACYESGLAGQAVVPIQAITSVLYCVGGLVGIYLFLKGYFLTAFILVNIGHQGWRFASEFLRADHRGNLTGSISKYQMMALLNILYVIGLSFYIGVQTLPLQTITVSLVSLWNPWVLVILQLQWLLIFFYTGRSTVTSCKVRYHLNDH